MLGSESEQASGIVVEVKMCDGCLT